jgi:hypothetical protein
MFGIFFDLIVIGLLLTILLAVLFPMVMRRLFLTGIILIGMAWLYGYVNDPRNHLLDSEAGRSISIEPAQRPERQASPSATCRRLSGEDCDDANHSANIPLPPTKRLWEAARPIAGWCKLSGRGCNESLDADHAR